MNAGQKRSTRPAVAEEKEKKKLGRVRARRRRFTPIPRTQARQKRGRDGTQELFFLGRETNKSLSGSMGRRVRSTFLMCIV